jgi:hypothetical protein
VRVGRKYFVDYNVKKAARDDPRVEAISSSVAV